MAWQVNNVILRNLQEQVEKNKQDIAKHYEIDRVLSDWGIKVLGVVNTPSDIPEGIYEYGDAYGVRTGSGIVYYVWTRANINVGQDEDYWLDIGALSLVGPTGPQGLQGPQGIQGVRGSLWVSSTTSPTSQIGNNGDQWLDTTTGDVYQKGTSTWARTGNIKGPQGVQGPTGPKGEQGIQGPTGSQGPKGDTGSSFKIGGLLNSIDNLPTPTEANRSVGYAVARQDNTYDLYVVVGTDNLQWVNMGRVEGVEGPQGPVGPQGPAGADIQIVTITGIPSTATQGTLTQTQVQTLLDHPGNYIQFFNENFYPQDVETDEGYIVYSHVGMFEGNTKIKTITLTIATGGWVLTETSLVSAPISIVNELPEANEENFEKGKIYTTGELLKYLAKVPLSEPNISQVNTLMDTTQGIGAARVGTKIYLFGGYQQYGHLTSIYEYDIGLNSLTKLDTVLPTGLYKISAVSVGTKIYLFGGIYWNNKDYGNILCFDTITKSIEIITSMQLSGVVVSAAVGTNIYYFQDTTVMKFDTLANTKSVITSLPATISRYGSISVVGDNIYLFYQSNIIKFNTKTNVANLLETQIDAGVTEAPTQSIGENIYLFGGHTNSSTSPTDRIIKFSTSNNTYEQLSTVFTQNIENAAAVSSANDIYIFGGYNNISRLNTVYKVGFGFNYTFKTISTQ